MKRFLFPLLISCSVLVLLSGCSGEGTDDGSLPPKPPKPPEPKKRKMLVKLPQAKKVYKQGDSIFVNLVKQDDSLVFDSVVFSIGSKELCVTSASGEINVPVPEGNFGTQKLAVTVFAKGKVVYETKSPSIELRSDVKPQYWGYEVVNTYPHDPRAYTQGLLFDGDVFYESTGMNGRSNVRKVDLKSGDVIQEKAIPNEYFGEGIAIVGDTLYELTWKKETCFLYDKKSLEPITEWKYPVSTEGWGLTYDGKHLIMSDGTETLHFLNPRTFQREKFVKVYDDRNALDQLNELEYHKGYVYANIYQDREDRIAKIEPQTGKVIAYIKLKGLLNPSDRQRGAEVLNGIAFHQKSGKMYVTGKNWPKLFEVKIPQDQPVN